MSKEPKRYLGKSVDIGTMNVVSARQDASGGISTKRIRDAFLDLPTSAKRMLKLNGVDFIERDDEILIIGDAAMETANVFGREPRRPLSGGLVSAQEPDSLEVLATIIKGVLGPPAEPNEVCYYSVPAAPIDAPERDVIYHRGVLERIVNECGYDAFPSNEAMAIIFAETAKDGFSGLALSFGSGMSNVALALNTIEGLSFSVARGGDWLDAGAASSVGSTKARICSIKEGGIDLNAPKNREEEAICFYYKHLIEYVLDQIAARFKQLQGQFALPKPIPIIIGGGTSQAIGFVEFFTKVFDRKRKRFPFEISEIRHAADPLNCVAHGLLVLARQEYEED